MTIFRHEFGKVILLEVLFLLPELLMSLALRRAMDSGVTVWPIARYYAFAAMALQLLAQVPVVYVTYARLSGKPMRMVDALRWSRFASVLGVGVVEHLASIVRILILGTPSFILSEAWVLITGAFWYVALSVVLIEDKGVLASLKRSVMLTGGHRVSVFGIVLIAAVAPGMALYFLDAVAFQFLGRHTVLFVDFMLRVFAIAIVTIVGTVTYQFLRTAKEGPAETVAEVFA